MHVMTSSWNPYPDNFLKSSPVLGFQILAVASSEQVTSIFPSGVNFPQVIGYSWPLNEAKYYPFAAFHIQAVLSALPATITFPFECQSINLISSAGPSKSLLNSPVSASHILIAPSSVPVAKNFPSKLNFAKSTVSFYLGVSISGLSGLFIFQTLATSSPPPEIN